MHRILLLASLLAGCSSLAVSTDYDPGTDFSALETWGWLHEGPAEGVDGLTDQRLRTAIEETLPARGLRAAAADESPDVLVSYQAKVEQRIETTPTSVSVGYGWHRGYGAFETQEIHTYDEGTLVIDLVAPGGETLLWRGVARGAVTRSRTPEEREARIREAVEQVLERFPPGD